MEKMDFNHEEDFSCKDCQKYLSECEKFNEIQDFVKEGKYKVSDYLKSRCIDGRYDKEEEMPGLAIPWADIWQIFIILAALNDINKNISKVGKNIDFSYLDLLNILFESINWSKNFEFHTDDHAGSSPEELWCWHALEIFKTPEAYWLYQEDKKFVLDLISKLENKWARKLTLKWGHKENAVVFIDEGVDFSVYPQIEENKQVFVYHKELVEKRNQIIWENLVNSKIIRVNDSDFASKINFKDTFIKTLNDFSLFHLNETASRLAKNFPIYKVSFGKTGDFEISYSGNV